MKAKRRSGNIPCAVGESNPKLSSTGSAPPTLCNPCASGIQGPFYIIHRWRNGKTSWPCFIWLTGSLRGGSNSVCTRHLLYCGLRSSHRSDCGPSYVSEDHPNEGGKAYHLSNHASAGNRTPSSPFEINDISMHTGCGFPDTPPTFSTVVHSLNSMQTWRAMIP